LNHAGTSGKKTLPSCESSEVAKSPAVPATVWFDTPPPTDGPTDQTVLTTQLANVASTSRLLCVRVAVPQATEQYLQVGLTAALILNFSLLGTGGPRILKLFQFVRTQGDFDDLERYATLNYCRAMLQGGYAALRNYQLWLKVFSASSFAPLDAEYRKIERFLESVSAIWPNDPVLSVAEAFVAVGPQRTDARRPLFELELPSEMSGTVRVGNDTHKVWFDQIARLGPSTVRSSWDRREVFVDLDLADLNLFLTGFANAAERMANLDFLRVGAGPRAGLAEQ
jgi:hypothetical protein